MIRPNYEPSPEEIERMKEVIFRENVARGTIRLEPALKGRFRGMGLSRNRRKPPQGNPTQGTVMMPPKRMTRKFKAGV